MEEEHNNSYFSCGKLLITGEYLVLDGAKALAVSTGRGQSMKVSVKPSGPLAIHWKSLDNERNCWMEVEFNDNLELSSFSNKEGAERLLKLLQKAKQLKPDFLHDHQTYNIITELDFPVDWGLGSSSTLVNNIADWAGVDPYQLQFEVFGGSGYDIACAREKSAIFYQLEKGKPLVQRISFSPTFSDQLFFVYLNKKQDSREGIKQFREMGKADDRAIAEISGISVAMAETSSVERFEELINRHEEIISAIVGKETVHQSLFPEYPHAMKSLGAWGGDFILCCGGRNEQEYFRDKGYHTILTYDQMVSK